MNVMQNMYRAVYVDQNYSTVSRGNKHDPILMFSFISMDIANFL